ncbi:MAG: hypothetical protein ACREBW_08710 [Candidatus Micrarchaeaceae archaeon]
MAAPAAPPVPLNQPAEHLLRGAAVDRLLHNVTHAASFAQINSHLTAAELAAVRRTTPHWPATKPVFSAYATCKPTAYYTPSKVQAADFVDNVRHLPYVHRVTCLQMHGPAPQLDDQASHRLGSGQIVGIERDINPNNLVWESEAVNKSRGACQLAVAAMMRAGHTFAASIAAITPFCQWAHVPDAIRGTAAEANYLCHFWDPAWGQPDFRMARHSSASAP